MKRFFATWNGLLPVFLTFLGCLNQVFAQTDLPQSCYSIWDKDKNDKLTHAEFYDGLSGTELFRLWDRNKSNSLSRQEFFARLDVFPLTPFSAKTPDPSQYQANSSSATLITPVTFSESGARDNKEKLFAKADLNRNSNLNQAEFYTLIFRVLDKDGNGFLTETEAEREAMELWFGRHSGD